MKNTTAVHAGIDNNIPLGLRLSYEKPTAIGGMSREELDAELAKGYKSIQSGKTCTADEVDAMLNEAFGI